MKKQKGFTLIELLIVIIIIGILAAIAIPMFLNQREKAKVSSVKEAYHTILVGVQSYATDYNDVYPATGNIHDTLVPSQIDVGGWPHNAWTNVDIDTSSGAEGQVTYTNSGSTFILVAHGPGTATAMTNQ